MSKVCLKEDAAGEWGECPSDPQAQLKAEEEELKRRAEEEKQARVQAYREKKRLEKQVQVS